MMKPLSLDKSIENAKGALQERLQKSGAALPQYTNVFVGPDHMKIWGSTAIFGNGSTVSLTPLTKSKKDSDKAVAYKALQIGVEYLLSSVVHILADEQLDRMLINTGNVDADLLKQLAKDSETSSNSNISEIDDRINQVKSNNEEINNNQYLSKLYPSNSNNRLSLYDPDSSSSSSTTIYKSSTQSIKLPSPKVPIGASINSYSMKPTENTINASMSINNVDNSIPYVPQSLNNINNSNPINQSNEYSYSIGNSGETQRYYSAPVSTLPYTSNYSMNTNNYGYTSSYGETNTTPYLASPTIQNNILHQASKSRSIANNLSSCYFKNNAPIKSMIKILPQHIKNIFLMTRSVNTCCIFKSENEILLFLSKCIHVLEEGTISDKPLIIVVPNNSLASITSIFSVLFSYEFTSYASREMIKYPLPSLPVIFVTPDALSSLIMNKSLSYFDYIYLYHGNELIDNIDIRSICCNMSDQTTVFCSLIASTLDSSKLVSIGSTYHASLIISIPEQSYKDSDYDIKQLYMREPRTPLPSLAINSINPFSSHSNISTEDTTKLSYSNPINSNTSYSYLNNSEQNIRITNSAPGDYFYSSLSSEPLSNLSYDQSIFQQYSQAMSSTNYDDAYSYPNYPNENIFEANHNNTISNDPHTISSNFNLMKKHM